jgi:hypothetical protein
MRNDSVNTNEQINPTKDDFNFYTGRKTPQQVEEEVSEIGIGLGYSAMLVVVAMLIIGTLCQVVVG